MAVKKPKTPADSLVESRYLVMPQHANQYGTAFGGVIVSWMDMVGSMVAQKHCGKEVVTAFIDSISFDEPIYIGDHVVIKAAVCYVGRTSMEVGVEVYKHNITAQKTARAITAYITFVALDKNKKPALAGAIVPKTALEKRQYQTARDLVLARKKMLKKAEKGLK
jgi:acyl-CoA hydrolase